MGTIYNLGCYPVSLLHFVIETAFGSGAFAKRQLHDFGNISTEGNLSALTMAFLQARSRPTATATIHSRFSETRAGLGLTNPWLPIAGDNIIGIKTYGGETELVVVRAELDAFGYQVKKVERYLPRGVKTAERPSPNIDQSVENMGLLTEWEALIQSQHK
ncbi:hypothetical protein FOQG_18779 [Fusarium oxysporum f. sp. raphani 54005]|uniref:Uncharacterized protein n=1 Tax=Fusarium oxysporum f. sp. raphani 54005 TaxID=1089458 RepID=X0B3Z9_FUSOX|nr:hypothetical protein FOQG_18779 [Fusarium oxysporum f. sp. raphani 54005]